MDIECGICHEFSNIGKLTEIKGKNMYSIIRLTSHYLQGLPDNLLLELYEIIRDGSYACDNCLKICEAIPDKCVRLGYKGKQYKYKGRIAQAKKDLGKIELEVARRVNLRKFIKR